MKVRSPQSQLDHDRMIRHLVADLHQQGYRNIRAAHLDAFIGYRPSRVVAPELPEGRVPDVEVNQETSRLLFEVETPDSLGTPHARKEIELFANLVQRHPEHYFYLVVPEASLAAAQGVLSELGLSRGRRAYLLGLP